MSALDTSSLDFFAESLAGNWRNFSCFAWSTKYDLEYPERWGIYYIENRDSGLLEKSNAQAIRKEFESMEENDDVLYENHGHWACGWLEAITVKVYDDAGNITESCKRLFDMIERLEEYPILDEEDYSQRELEITIENIETYGYKFDEELPKTWASEVYSWLSGNDQGEVENTDDQGGFPSLESVTSALIALGYLDEDEDEQ